MRLPYWDYARLESSFFQKRLGEAGLLERLNAENGGIVAPSSRYNYNRDEETKLLNPESIKDYSLRLADAVNSLLHENKFPIVLGGDCSILIGNLLALRRIGRYDLFFIDGHADFYRPEESPTGEVADMDLAIVSGHGPDILSNLEDLKPLVMERDVVVFGYRDSEQSAYVIVPATRVLATAPVNPDGTPTAELDAAVARAKRVTVLELIGFLVVFTCMILMRFGL